ncbi:S1 RNA-binding domain-containing protein [Sutcliffiella cohnii]|uniref:S1 motif domain-containing protein n=1 Tax=Sutcliffiella cohnii TaxID=33932 RepID=A0A223KM35_9BACI|nr:S1-like domain-containing RNA-binding protein [Sutcliffiella cohnii]AST90570.1 hypothetical protein BC6307_04390 [Sutcliffiella cohnii]MED4016854.1 S1-like domain-containing RNA-binding protein [Sutcliffiella cohnii]
MELRVGNLIELEVERETPLGFSLTNGEESILLHSNEVNGEVTVGETVKVFLYTDQKGRLSATMHMPKGYQSHDWVEVIEVVRNLGVFIDIGLSKDALIPAEDLPVFESLWPKEGSLLFCRIKTDRRGMLLGKLATHDVMLDKSVAAPKEILNKNIQGTIYRLLKVGSYIFTNEGYVGFIHHSERKEEPRLGDIVEGRIIDVKRDGTINVSLLPRKQEALDEDSQVILDYMETRNGTMPYSDKSAPEDITERFHMSKAAFKRALGRLMKEGKVYQKEGWTYRKTE